MISVVLTLKLLLILASGVVNLPSKLLESFIGAWILDRTEDELDVNQYGALKGRSTTHALVDMVHHWHKALAVDEGQSVRAVFIDFAKAFDHVDHSILV